jgi:hypothetical protein
LKYCVYLLIFFNSWQGFAQSVILWDETRKLTWNDFNGEPNDSTSAAGTFCAVEARLCKESIVEGRVFIEVLATFDADTSWYRPEISNELTLRHEQGHFDIAEWYARELRKEMSTKINTVADYNKHFQVVYDGVYDLYISEQQAYERETRFGTLHDEQKKWEEKIVNNLTRLKQYKQSVCPSK